MFTLISCGDDANNSTDTNTNETVEETVMLDPTTIDFELIGEQLEEQISNDEAYEYVRDVSLSDNGYHPETGTDKYMVSIWAITESWSISEGDAYVIAKGLYKELYEGVKKQFEEKETDELTETVFLKSVQVTVTVQSESADHYGNDVAVQIVVHGPGDIEKRNPYYH